jgi:hypothetical protein
LKKAFMNALCALLAAVLLAGCADDDKSGPSDAGTDGDTDTDITAFELADQYWMPEDLRTIEAEVDFPTAGEWERIDMKIDLTCPEDGDCDNWDRFANVYLVEDAGTVDEEAFELERYITPYNIGMCLLTDVTRFAPRLQGTKTVRSFISTWVGPDEPVHGHGWRITIKFVFHPGDAPEGMPSQILNVWGYSEIEVGNPDNPIDGQIAPQTLAIPGGTTQAELRVVVTGHGQGNHQNCAEFCNLNQVVFTDDEFAFYDPWRADCDENPIGPLQSGTWQYPRSGWCPGAYVIPQVFDVTEDVTPGTDATFHYEVWDQGLGIYENTCRPGAGDADNICEGCVFTPDEVDNCEYNGGNHTMPRDHVTVQLVLYE